MVDCGFDAYQLPVVPRACRSPRGRRQKWKKKLRSESEVLAQVVGKLPGDCKNRVAIAHEPKEDFFVNNFLETMEVKVKPQLGREKPSPVLLSKDWLALGPSISSSPITEEGNSEIDGKRKMCYTKGRGSCSSQESQNMYPLKKRKLFNQNHRPESCDAPSTELLVDISESATVGSLKIAVHEAVTRILEDGINIGVLLQGKTIVDDSKTLLQIGIPRDDDDDHNLSSLGFTLEPRSSETTTRTLISSSPKTRLRAPGSMESIETVVAKAVVPVRMKPASRSEMVQRRIRRPFTVSEVEALVDALERLGTGRTNGKRWFTRQRYQQSKGEANQCLKTFLIGF
ncbi:unnamed protein product [Arabis nemorensis]|uniref:Telomere repeat-binding protein 1-6-like ubiquitin-like domain-containing protein n=1 Tax=Arabis nemorensis TaxID=586526 RepID=A0A565BW18_9BRAS|nr:unnamed protein product [Arabis nemorensis]